MRHDLIILLKPDVGRDLCLVGNCGLRCGAHLVFTDALGAFNDFQTPFNQVKNTQIRDDPINDTFADLLVMNPDPNQSSGGCVAFSVSPINACRVAHRPEAGQPIETTGAVSRSRWFQSVLRSVGFQDNHGCLRTARRVRNPGFCQSHLDAG